ncbi:hypothetical protein BKK49_03770 [Rodentibacter rarus]|uniref:Uncharacterized protein n=1 Tax=Rodentibacter rarus TaxID=1908260 RepID=A0A1V3II40_9PAST|nr:hypothetical protein BKK50_09150 [Rodentibacter rarus]OOF41965.1 hypothetical protein BKK49_03770 [Rodentibacter rarus]
MLPPLSYAKLLGSKQIGVDLLPIIILFFVFGIASGISIIKLLLVDIFPWFDDGESRYFLGASKTIKFDDIFKSGTKKN